MCGQEVGEHTSEEAGAHLVLAVERLARERAECERQFQVKVARVNELEGEHERLNDEKQAFNTWILDASQREETLRTELRDEHDIRVDTEHALHQRQLGERAKLVEVLTYHWATQTAGCSCGWGELGKSWPEHVADVYEASRPGVAPGRLDVVARGFFVLGVDRHLTSTS